MTFKIMIVDDCEDNRTIISAALTKGAYETIEIANGEECLLSIENSLPDLILMDIRMPGINGYDLCRLLKEKEETSHIPIIFLSAENSVTSKARGLNLGAADYIAKPFHRAEILARVRNHLSKQSEVTELRKSRLKLEEEKNALQDEEDIAGEILRSFLPTNGIYLDRLKFFGDILFCKESGGDMPGFIPISKTQGILFLTDVNGCSAISTLLSASISKWIYSEILSKNLDSIPKISFNPKMLVEELDRVFTISKYGKYFSFICVLVDLEKNTLTYCNASHPFPILIRANGNIESLNELSSLVGLGNGTFTEHIVTFHIGDQLLLYSDGLLEYEDSLGEFYGKERLINFCKENSSLSIDKLISELVDAMNSFGGQPRRDIVSLVGVELQ